jgi:Mg-chelatase subunit ChlD
MEAGATATYRLAELSRDPRDAYHFTGDIEAEGIDLTPVGRFRMLRVRFGVDTPGGQCWWWGSLSDEAGHRIDFRNGNPAGPLPPGKSMLALDFEGFNVARLKQDGPLLVSDLTLKCAGRDLAAGGEVVDRGKHRTPSFSSSDFDNPEPDFEFVVKRTPIRVATGDAASAGVELRAIGGLDLLTNKVVVTVQATEPKLGFRMFGSHPCQASPSCVEGEWTSLGIHTPPDLAFGTYTVHVAGRAAGKEHAATFDLIVDPELTRRKQQHDAALAALSREDPPVPILPVPGSAPTPTPKEPDSVTFSADVSLRKIHAILVLDRSGSMNNNDACRFLRAAATRFSQMFVDGRDWLGVISFSDTAELTLPLTDHFQPDAPDRISKIACQGNTNTGAALQMAQLELVKREDPEAIDAVILFTDGKPNVLAASWPVKMGGVLCAEARGAKELPAMLRTDDRGSMIWFRPVASTKNPPAATAPSRNSCFVPAMNGRSPIDNFAYIPEKDLNGIPLTGNHSLERLTVGQNAGRIRIDSMENIFAVLANQVENAAQQLRSGPNPAFVYVIGFKNTVAESMLPINFLRQLANDPQSPFLDQKQPVGITIMTEGPEGFWPSFLTVRQAIVKQATIQ